MRCKQTDPGKNNTAPKMPSLNGKHSKSVAKEDNVILPRIPSFASEHAVLPTSERPHLDHLHSQHAF